MEDESIRNQGAVVSGDLTLRILRIGSIVSSSLLVLLGLAIGALGIVPSDAPGFFLVFGAQALVAGAAGFVPCFTKGSGWVRVSARIFSVLANGALVIRVVWAVIDGQVLGPMIVMAPLLLGVPALINLGAAALGVRLPVRAGTCRECGYDLKQLDVARCPECGTELGAG